MNRKMEERTCTFAASVMLKHLTSLRMEIEGVETANDIESIHRMRVASRRLRCAFMLFQNCFPEKKISGWKSQIRQVTKSLGAARDLDVQIETLKAAQQHIEQIQLRPGIHRLQLRLQQRREKMQPRVVQAMNDLRNSSVLEEMDTKLSALTEKGEGTQPYTLQLYQLAHEAITVHLSHLHSYEALIVDPDEIEALHAMRIDAKHLRYTLEIFAPLYPDRSEEFIKLTKTLQEVLGNIHDCDVWIDYLPRFSQKERERTRNYYGHEAPFNLLQPGLTHFALVQKDLRDQQYTLFINSWNTWKAQKVWEDFKNTVDQPISFKKEVYSPPPIDYSNDEHQPDE